MAHTRNTVELLDCLAPECDGLTAHEVVVRAQSEDLIESVCRACGKRETYEEN